jgi:hypothetical protein
MRIPFGAIIMMLGMTWDSLAQDVRPSAPQPTAHDPWYSTKEVWPNLTGAERFVHQKWDKARVLVWAHPGTGGQLDPNQRRSRNPIQMSYHNSLQFPVARCATPRVGMNAAAMGGDGVIPVGVDVVPLDVNAVLTLPDITGNLWLQTGERFTPVGRGGARVKGGRHTFIRNDNLPPDPESTDRGVPWKRANARMILGLDIVVTKQPGFSVEYVGNVQADDELVVWSGTAIVSENSILRPGRASCQIIGAEGTLQLQSGAYFGKGGSGRNPVDIRVDGKIQAGSPDRPITRDAVLGICSPNVDEEHHGLLVTPQGTMAVHSADPAQARLVMRWGSGRLGTQPDDDEKIFITLLGKHDLNGVLFDNIAAGGIRLKDSSQKSQWKNVFYGQHNQGAADALFAGFSGPTPTWAGSGRDPIKDLRSSSRKQAP